MTLTQMRKIVRVPARVVFFMEGTGWWQHPTAEGDSDRAALREAITSRPSNADGSISLRPTASWLVTLREQAEYLAGVARDDSGWEADARADLNSARAFVRRIERLGDGA